MLGRMGIPAARNRMATKPASASATLILENDRASGADTRRNKQTITKKPSVFSRIGAGITGLVGTVKKDIQKVQSTVKSAETAAVNELRQIGGNIVTHLPNQGRVANRIGGQVVNGVKAGVKIPSSGIDLLGQKARAGVETIKETVSKDVSKVQGAVKTGIQTVKADLGIVRDTVKQDVTKGLTTVHNVLGSGGSGIKNIVTQAASGAKSGIRLVGEGIHDLIDIIPVKNISDAGKQFLDIAKPGYLMNHLKDSLKDTGKSIVSILPNGKKIKRTLFLVLLGGGVIAYLLWDNTRGIRRDAIDFTKNTGAAFLGTAARTAIPIPRMPRAPLTERIAGR